MRINTQAGLNKKIGDGSWELRQITKLLTNFLLCNSKQSAIAFSLTLAFLTACNANNQVMGPVSLNSRYADEQPALSGNGRFLALVSNRDGKRGIWLYDLQQRRFLNLPRLNRRDAIAETPSISYTARYIVYLASDRGRPEVELYDRVTGSISVLTTGYRGWVRNPSISPDGRLVTFETDRRGQWDIEVIDRGPNVERDLPDAQPLSPN